MPMNQISAPAISAMARLVAIVLSPRLPAAAHQSDRQSVLQDEQIGRADAEHHQRVPVQAIAQPAPDRAARRYSSHGQRVDVADAATVEIAGAGVVHGVGTPPEIIGRQRQHADDAADPVVCSALAEKGAVAAIVLDHEQPHQKSRGRHGEQKREPVAEIERRPHQNPERHEWDNCDYDLDDTTAIAGLPVGRENLRPGARIRCGCG